MFHPAIPFTDSILIFTLILVLVLIAPALFKKIKFPEIIGLILAGLLIGPHGLNFISNDSSISILGKTGLIYLMFLAGLEINVKEFLQNKKPSITFGLLTFLVPFITTGLVFYYLLNFNFLATLVISSMVASHTLVAYPIIGRFGINNNRVINILIGGTIITDTTALLIFGIVSESAKESLDFFFWIRFVGYFLLFLGFVLWIIPKISKWFFKNHDGDSGTEYIFVLTMVFLAAVAAEFAFVEPIIGAFFAGLALSKLIPTSSPLMNRIQFIGNTIFIPFFLITVGMLANLQILLQSPALWLLIFVLLVISMGSKYLAALITQLVFRFTKPERNLLFGLSNARAASALAIIIVSFNLNIINESVMNATIILVLFSCLVSSFVTQNSARKIAVAEIDKKPEQNELIEKILVPISNPARIEQLINFSVLIKNPKSTEPLYPLTIVADDDKASENVLFFNNILEKAKKQASSSDIIAKVISRIDTNVADGIARTVKELQITKVIMGWHGKVTTIDFFFGTLLENVLAKTGQMIIVTRIIKPINLIENIHVLIPPAAELEIGFVEWARTVFSLVKQTNSKLYFWGYDQTHISIKELIKKSKIQSDVVFRSATCPAMLKLISKKFIDNDLLVVINARKNSLSFNRQVYQITSNIDAQFVDSNFIIIYPEQEILYKETINLQV
ncbi:MAG: hypothetical protein A2W99_05835 [Bacteroidetes bacterium GWF2_33_16]|nr:MAG: hypothetical protein A2X00_13060 [Bacteroidetes bacterium GWE2_32_14]OFY05207.1 MAG: hypothetical protein A2W99_05835 [Bacteroidetes bacterium GWF2_33_16]